jgi:hypothetical protein
VSRLSAGAASGRAATAEKTLDKLNAEGVKVPPLCHALSSCTALLEHRISYQLQGAPNGFMQTVPGCVTAR